MLAKLKKNARACSRARVCVCVWGGGVHYSNMVICRSIRCNIFIGNKLGYLMIVPFIYRNTCCMEYHFRKLIGKMPGIQE